MFIVAALVGSIIAISGVNNAEFATKKKSKDSLQDITQESLTDESAECFSNNNTLASCNNLAPSFNLNDDNNATGQQ